MQEQTFFEYEDVKVTNARFVTGGQTYAMQNITSVKTKEDGPAGLGWGIILWVAAAVCLWNKAWGWAAILAIVGALLMWKSKATYHIILTTASGEASALKTHQKEYLQKVVEALNQAIIARG
jgi:hypothetical protein